MRLSLFLLLVWPTIATAQLKITGTLQTPAYRLVRLTAEGAPAGSALVWDVTPEEVVDVEEAGGKLLFVGPPGRYRVKCRAFTLKDGKLTSEVARAEVTIGTPGPTPPPDPTPPPPDPTPEPTDAFYLALKAAYAKDSVTDRAKRADLAAVFAAGADAVKSATVPTAFAYFQALQQARKARIGEALPQTRTAITAYLDTVLPRSTTAPLDDAARKLIATELGKVASYLGKLP